MIILTEKIVMREKFCLIHVGKNSDNWYSKLKKKFSLAS